ncbi:hypothetical protein [Telluribacter sp. SYSU D00476]|uniref:hypothetical protein n=1 Tax=Telluribacter sp. SYSU D00476 TaxID=2811430 RepID=UPI001FF19756|nr:hypothetical protein [Telluribacter sp. SYSU D00476]
MKNSSLALLALLGAPTLWLGFYIEGRYPHLSNSWFTGLWGLIYMCAWMCSIVCMQRLKVTGTTRFGKGILWVILGTLTLANWSNVIQLVSPEYKPAYFFYLDACWPISNFLMLPIGITAFMARGLSGWRRYVPLVPALWYPVLVISMLLLGRTTATGLILGIHSALGWTLLALALYLESRKTESKATTVSIKYELA